LPRAKLFKIFWQPHRRRPTLRICLFGVLFFPWYLDDDSGALVLVTRLFIEAPPHHRSLIWAPAFLLDFVPRLVPHLSLAAFFFVYANVLDFFFPDFSPYTQRFFCSSPFRQGKGGKTQLSQVTFTSRSSLEHPPTFP